jgi:tRNA-dihydrouridine synthase B
MSPSSESSKSRLTPYGINFPVCLAPMVGLTHVALRLVIRSYLPPGSQVPWPTEMLNSRRLPNEKVGFTPETFRADEETFLMPQILGNEEKAILESIKRLEDWGAQGIDINMGCPVQKALKHNYGVALMGDAAYAAGVVKMATQSTKLPVSVKLRAADGSFSYLLDFVKGLRESGASWICLHPRTAEQKRRGNADWSQIRALREAVDFPIIGNGDIQTAADVYKMKEQTGCDLVMSGRGLAARPWMLWQIAEDLNLEIPEALRHREAPRTQEEEGAEYGHCLLKFMDLCELYFGEDLGMRKVRFYIRTTSVWLQFGHTLGSISTKSRNFSELRLGVMDFFRVPQAMVERTELRQ